MGCRVIILLRFLVFKTSPENQKICSVKCTGKMSLVFMMTGLKNQINNHENQKAGHENQKANSGEFAKLQRGIKNYFL